MATRETMSQEDADSLADSHADYLAQLPKPPAPKPPVVWREGPGPCPLCGSNDPGYTYSDCDACFAQALAEGTY